jgi:hypothetical protein
MNVKLFEEAVSETVTEPSERPIAAYRALVVAVVGLGWLTVFHEVTAWAPAGPIGRSTTAAAEASVVIPLVAGFALLSHRFLDPLSALAANAVATAASLGAAELLDPTVVTDDHPTSHDHRGPNSTSNSPPSKQHQH